MKNNIKKIVFLLPLSLLIWGAITYKIFQGLNPPTANEYAKQMKSEKAAKISSDRFTLHLNYRDPFLDNQLNNENNSLYTSDLANANSKSNQMANLKQWPVITYFGSIINMKTKKELYLITIDSKKYLMQKGERVNGYELKYVNKDSVIIKLINEYKTFKRSKL